MMDFILIILGWLSGQLGVKTDAANASGSLHAKLAELKTAVPKFVVASSNARLSSAASVSNSDSAYYQQAKIFQVLHSGVVRVSFQYYGASVAPYAYVGTPGYSSPTYTAAANTTTTVTVDIPVVAGQLVSIFIKPYTTGYWAYVLNASVSFDYQSDLYGNVIS
jgi:hypothetical protein